MDFLCKVSHYTGDSLDTFFLPLLSLPECVSRFLENTMLFRDHERFREQPIGY